ncbi:MAG: hypothetical protein AAFV32_00470 [Myxococcota bacterium]
MSQSFDDMPEIELDDIVGQPIPANSQPAVDDQAIELDLSARPIPVPEAPAPRIDDDAIDLGLDLPATRPQVEAATSQATPSASSATLTDLDAIVSEVAPFSPSETPSADPSPAVDVDALLADIDDGLTAMSHGPENNLGDSRRITPRNEALPEIDNDPLSALNVDLEAGVRSARPTVDLQPVDVTVEPDPDAHEVELDASVDVEVDSDPDAAELEADSVEMHAEIEAEVVTELEAEVEAEVELEASPTIETSPVPSDGFAPQPLLDVLSDEATLPGGYVRPVPATNLVDGAKLPSVFGASPVFETPSAESESLSAREREPQATAAVLRPEPESGSGLGSRPDSTAESGLGPRSDSTAGLDSASLSDQGARADGAPLVALDDEMSTPFEFRAEHAPIGDESSLDSQSSPLLIAPADDPDAPPLPLSTHEPPGRPKVPLEQLRPDPKMIESLKRLAGPASEPELARQHLVAAMKGQDHDPRALPEPQHVALGLARYLVENGHDPDQMADAIIAIMMV